MIPLVESQDRVEIYVGDTHLLTLLETGQILVTTGSTTRVVTPSDVGLRLNNWDRVRAARIPLLLVSATVAGVLIGMIVIGLFGPLRQVPLQHTEK